MLEVVIGLHHKNVGAAFEADTDELNEAAGDGGRRRLDVEGET